MLDALDIYSKRYIVTLCIWNHLVHVQKGVVCTKIEKCLSCYPYIYYNIPLVSLIKNFKILEFTSCEIKHNYCEQKVRVLGTLIYAQCIGTSSHIITVDFIVCRCTGASSHIIMVALIVCRCTGTSSHIVTVDF